MSTFDRRLLVAGVLALAVYNGLLAMFHAPHGTVGQYNHIVPHELIRGSRFLLLIAALTLLFAVPGLLRAGRRAWLLALAACAASLVSYPLKNLDLWGMGGSALLIGMLVGARPYFTTSEQPARAVKGVLTILGGLAIVFGYAVAGLYLLNGEFRQSINMGSAVMDGLRLILIVPNLESHPVTPHAAGFLDSIRVAVVFLWVVGFFAVVQPAMTRWNGYRPRWPSVRPRTQH